LAYLIHWPDWPPGWDATAPTTEATTGPLHLPARLRPRTVSQVSLALTGAEVVTKQRALAVYVTQQEAMPSLLAAFVRQTEPFTIFSAGDLEQVRLMIAGGEPKKHERRLN
jgi:hypothetical protein